MVCNAPNAPPRASTREVFAVDTAQVQEHIWRSVSPVPVTGCWLWTLQVGANGYPRMSIGQKSYLPAHRIAYRAFRLNGKPIPEGMFVCHKCDTPSCVNPDHLFLGTARDNTRDMIAKGRSRLFGSVVDESHCCRGHAWSAENTYWYRGSRQCRTCNKIAATKYRARLAARKATAKNTEVAA